MCAVIEPRSVSTTSRVPPSLQRSCSGSAASWATVKGWTSMSPIAIGSASRAKRSVAGAPKPPVARQVPRLIHSGSRSRSASARAQPMWSPCSWVTNTASRSEAARPARASRVSSSLSEKPASTSSRVVVMPLDASTTVALPPLPLPMLRKRITRRRACASGRSLQVFEEQADDPLAGFAAFGLALRIEDGDGAGGAAFGGDLDPVLGQAARPRPSCRS